MDDLISRQAAIDALGGEPIAFTEYEQGLHDKWVDAKENIEALPSVQPDAMPVVRCEHCAHKKNCQWYYYSGDDYGFCNWAVRGDSETES